MLLTLAASSYLWLNIPAISSFCKAELPKGQCVAYVARFYKQGKARSYYHLYLSDYTGKRQNQLTVGQRDVEDYFWQDNNHFITLKSDQRIQPNAAEFHFELTRINISNRKEQVLKSWSSTDKYNSLDEKADELQIGQKRFKINGSRLTPLPRVIERSEEKRPELTDAVILKDTNHQLWEDLGIKDKSIEFKTIDQDGEGSIITIKSGNQSHEARLPEGFLESGYRVGKGDLIVVMKPTGTRPAKSYVTYINTKTAQTLTLISGYGDVDFDVSRRIWLGSSSEWEDDYGQLNDSRSVPTRPLVAGDWKTGQVFTIAKGLVFAYQASLRPE